MKIYVNYSYTKNLGNYQSTKVEMGVEEFIPTDNCDISTAIALQDAFEFVKKEVNDALLRIK